LFFNLFSAPATPNENRVKELRKPSSDADSGAQPVAKHAPNQGSFEKGNDVELSCKHSDFLFNMTRKWDNA